jgi:hypothetical protein
VAGLQEVEGAGEGGFADDEVVDLFVEVDAPVGESWMRGLSWSWKREAAVDMGFSLRILLSE